MRINRPETWGWSPTEQLDSLRREIDHLFGSSLDGLARTDESFTGWAPTLDLMENNENLVAQIELPGVAKEDIEVSVHDGVLSVAGERRHEAKDESGGFCRQERYYGRFHRTVMLPKPVKFDAATASYANGILTVTLPKTEEARPRQITVNAG